jgi:hypothetical protein
MRKTIIFIILLSVIGLFGDTPTNEEYSSIDDIVKYYSLYKKIDMLESNIDSLSNRCLCLEQKVAVLEMAVTRDIFDGYKTVPFNPQPSETNETKIVNGNDILIKKLTKEMNQNYDDVMDEILMLWEAIYKIQDGK